MSFLKFFALLWISSRTRGKGLKALTINDWSINPFKPTVKSNYLIGRGANDMKSSIACFVSAVKEDVGSWLYTGMVWWSGEIVFPRR